MSEKKQAKVTYIVRQSSPPYDSGFRTKDPVEAAKALKNSTMPIRVLYPGGVGGEQHPTYEEIRPVYEALERLRTAERSEGRLKDEGQEEG